ncbi:MFS transporter, partial [Francisella tularensis subsp. holarctica]|nr:MFS transporter [Francisella tularensis subsp. holarctica]
YTAVFGYVAIGILVNTIIMFILTPILNKYINRIRVIDDNKADIDNITYPQN